MRGYKVTGFQPCALPMFSGQFERGGVSGLGFVVDVWGEGVPGVGFEAADAGGGEADVPFVEELPEGVALVGGGCLDVQDAAGVVGVQFGELLPGGGDAEVGGHGDLLPVDEDVEVGVEVFGGAFEGADGQ